MNQLQPLNPGASPFDQIRRTRPDGSEYWSARELMPLLGYEQWRRFDEAIDRAVASCRNAGVDAGDNFLQVVQRVGAGNLGDQGRNDYSLSRFACYLVAMNGDPRKREIAEAQTYFAVRTREAETAKPRDLSRKDLALMVIAAEEALEQAENRAALAESQAADLLPAAYAWDTLASANGDFSVADAAKILSRDKAIKTGQGRLFTTLYRLGWTYRQQGDGRWRAKQSAIDAGRLSELAGSHYHPRTGELVLDAPQVRVTVKGILALQKHLGGQSQLPALMSEELAAA